MKKHIAVVIDWFGPYKLNEKLRIATRDYYSGGLYVSIGKTKFKKQSNLQYIGISDSLHDRVNVSHPKLNLIERDNSIWLGEIVSFSVPGKRIFVKESQLEIAEWALIYFLKPRLNVKKRAKPPSHPCTVLNRWWHSNYNTPRMTSPHPDWADIINYYGMDEEAQVIYLKRVTGRIKRIKPGDI